MLMIEMFSGSAQMSNTFKSHGWDTLSVDYNSDLNPDLCANVYDLLNLNKLQEICGKIPNVIWLSPDCTTYSIAAGGYHRYQDWNLKPLPRTEYAEQCDVNNTKLFNFLRENNDKFLWFVENPRGYMRKMDFVKGFPRYEITFCQYGDFRQKPTDIFTNYPDPEFKPPCKKGSSCHISAKRGSPFGTIGLRKPYERAKLPVGLCEYIYTICEKYYNLNGD